MPKSSAKAADAAEKLNTGKPGRKTEFRPIYVQQARKMALLGLTNDEIASVFEVTKRTLTTWISTHKPLAEALRQGKVMADANVAAALYERAIGYTHDEIVLHQFGGQIIKTKVRKHYPPDTQAATKWLHNRQAARWKAQVDPTDPGGDIPPPVKVVFEVVDARKTSSAAAEPAAG